MVPFFFVTKGRGEDFLKTYEMEHALAAGSRDEDPV